MPGPLTAELRDVHGGGVTTVSSPAGQPPGIVHTPATKASHGAAPQHSCAYKFFVVTTDVMENLLIEKYMITSLTLIRF